MYMNKKICHITSVHRRYDVRIFSKECRSLAKAGMDVYLLVNDGKENEEIDGVKFVSINFNAKNRYERMVKLPKLLEKKALKIDAEIYHLHDPELLPLAYKLKKKHKLVIF